MSESELFEHGYAVLIGVDENATQGAELPTVARDVQALNDVLVHPQRCAYKSKNVRLLMGREATGKNILESLDWLQQRVTADPQATTVIYYSGHGHVDKASGQYYLIPYDFQGLSRLDDSAIKAETFAGRLAAIQAPRTLIILDCCHAEGMDAKAFYEIPIVERAPFPIDNLGAKAIPGYTGEPGGKALDELIDGEGRAVLNSSKEDQLSWVRKDGAMSLFTYHLIEGLTGHATPPDDNVVLVTDVMSWVQRHVKRSAERDERPAQVPVMKTEGVFPVAQSIGGQGVAKGLDGKQPDPLAPLPVINIEVGHAEGAIITGEVDTGDGYFAGRDIDKSRTTINQQGLTFSGSQINVDGEGDVGQIGDRVSIGSISDDSDVTIGRGSEVAVTKGQKGVGSDANLDAMFAPLAALAAAQDPALAGKVDELKAQVSQGKNADDEAVANLIFDIAGAAPQTKTTIKTLFSVPQVSEAAGPATNFALGRLG